MLWKLRLRSFTMSFASFSITVSHLLIYIIFIWKTILTCIFYCHWEWGYSFVFCDFVLGENGQEKCEFSFIKKKRRSQEKTGTEKELLYRHVNTSCGEFKRERRKWTRRHHHWLSDANYIFASLDGWHESLRRGNIKNSIRKVFASSPSEAMAEFVSKIGRKKFV